MSVCPYTSSPPPSWDIETASVFGEDLWKQLHQGPRPSHAVQSIWRFIRVRPGRCSDRQVSVDFAREHPQAAADESDRAVRVLAGAAAAHELAEPF